MEAKNASEEEIQESVKYLDLHRVVSSQHLMEVALRDPTSNVDLRGAISVRRNH